MLGSRREQTVDPIYEVGHTECNQANKIVLLAMPFYFNDKLKVLWLYFEWR